jgi:hypothetical protein
VAPPIIAALLACVSPAFATSDVVPAGEPKPIQLALFEPVQLFPRATPIHGLRLSIYGANSHLCGADIGIVNRIDRDMNGYQMGFLGSVDGTFRGWQHNYVNLSADLRGFQSGFYNQADAAEGVQIGLVNVTDSMRGFQLALVNVTSAMEGLQVGLVNVIQEKERLPFLPIVNWSF